MSLESHSDEEEPITKVVKLDLLLGGKQPPKQGDNWLNRLSMWTFFIAYNKSFSNVDAFMCQILDKRNNSTYIRFILPKEEIHKWVVTVNFSNDYYLLDILEEGDDYIECDRSNSDRGLETNEDIKQVNTVVRETE